MKQPSSQPNPPEGSNRLIQRLLMAGILGVGGVGAYKQLSKPPQELAAKGVAEQGATKPKTAKFKEEKEEEANFPQLEHPVSPPRLNLEINVETGKEKDTGSEKIRLAFLDDIENLPEELKDVAKAYFLGGRSDVKDPDDWNEILTNNEEEWVLVVPRDEEELEEARAELNILMDIGEMESSNSEKAIALRLISKGCKPSDAILEIPAQKSLDQMLNDHPEVAEQVARMKGPPSFILSEIKTSQRLGK